MIKPDRLKKQKEYKKESTEMFIRGIARNVVYGALWFLFLLYLERSRALDAAMSGERCDLPLWCVALMVVVLALAM